MREKGKTRREIAEYYGMSVIQIKNLINRHNRGKKRKAEGILPQRRGRPTKADNLAGQDMESTIKRLKMENELLRDFIQLAGRR
jgi:transposase